MALAPLFVYPLSKTEENTAETEEMGWAVMELYKNATTNRWVDMDLLYEEMREDYG